MDSKDKKQPVTKSQDLGITVDRETEFSEWYVQVVTKAEMIEYSDISGCYVLRPWAYALWEGIQQFFDREIKKMGVMNAYFPLFVSSRALQAEKDHIAGFAPEVAWVTKAGDSILKEPIAVRPTSETIMYPFFANWIRSWRDLPLKVNQWCNVVRWEFKHPVPFLRSREFLWQEGHTAFATLEEAAKEVMDILDAYERTYRDLLAIPVIKGKKSENEKFAGGYYTTTCEAFVAPSGRSIQAATSHCLGQNFAKIFKIQFEAEKEGEKQFVWQNSWGLSTRSLGVITMIHGDNKGLVLPPRVAPIQAVIVPIYMKDNHEKLDAKGREIVDILTKAGLRAKLDDRTTYKPGWKFNYWEVKGVPLKIEIGERDLEKSQVVISRRDTGSKSDVPFSSLLETVTKLLDEIHNNLYERAKKIRDEHIVKVTKWEDFMKALAGKNMCLCSWCEESACEEEAKKRSQKESSVSKSDEQFQLSGSAKSLCIPFDQPPLPEDILCFQCGKKAKVWCLFGRSY
jgi:prolyl-tRNA synthetase